MPPSEAAGDDPLAAVWRGLADADRLPSLALERTTDRGEERVAGRAAWIDLHHLGSDDVFVDLHATPAQRAEIDAEVAARAGAAPTTVRLDAERIRLLPFAITREAMLAHAGGALHGTAVLPFLAAARPWLVADDVRGLRVVDAVQGVVEGEGTRVLLSAGAQAGLFEGDVAACAPARLMRRQPGRLVVAEGPRIRVLQENDTRIVALPTFADGVRLPPVVTTHQSAADPSLAHVAAVCDGAIDVLPDGVHFGGPVATQSLFADGRRDPDGLRVDAARLRLDRHRDTGELIAAEAGDVRVRWAGLEARGAKVELDLRRGLCRVRDPDGAELALANGGRFTAPLIEANYLTMRVSCYHGKYAGTLSGASR